MKAINTIKLFYVIYTLYTCFVLLVSDYRLVYAITGLICIWVAFFCFSLGYYSVHKDETENRIYSDRFPLSGICGWNICNYLFALLTAWISTILCAKFYAGRSFVSIIGNFSAGDSAYYMYQKYFEQNNLGAFEITKIPYIIMLAYLSIIMIWSVLSILLSNERKKWWQWVYLFGIILAYLYFGVARGTNFETYIVFVLISYCMLQRMSLADRQKKLKYLAIFLALAITMVLVFRVVVMQRGVVFANKLCAEINYDNTRAFARLFPNIAAIGVSVFGYLGYGIYAIGTAMFDIVFDPHREGLAILLPSGFRIVSNQSLEELLRSTIDLGVKWCPDYIKLLDVLGLPLLLLLLFVLGRITANLQKGEYPLILKNVLIMLVFLQMLSLPIGNFLVVSTSNELMVIFALIWFIQYRFLRLDFHIGEVNLTKRQVFNES